MVPHWGFASTRRLGRVRKWAHHLSVLTAATALALTIPGLTSPGTLAARRWRRRRGGMARGACARLVGPRVLDGDLAQYMNGKFTGCLRVPVVPPGTYYISLEDILDPQQRPPLLPLLQPPGSDHQLTERL